jgi:hypothetical protein
MGLTTSVYGIGSPGIPQYNGTTSLCNPLPAYPYSMEVVRNALVSLNVMYGFGEDLSPLEVHHLFPVLVIVRLLLVHSLQL